MQMLGRPMREVALCLERLLGRDEGQWGLCVPMATVAQPMGARRMAGRLHWPLQVAAADIRVWNLRHRSYPATSRLGRTCSAKWRLVFALLAVWRQAMRRRVKLARAIPAPASLRSDFSAACAACDSADRPWHCHLRRRRWCQCSSARPLLAVVVGLEAAAACREVVVRRHAAAVVKAVATVPSAFASAAAPCRSS